MPFPGNVLDIEIEVQLENCAGLILVESKTAMTRLKEEQKLNDYIRICLAGYPSIASRILAAKISKIIGKKFKGLLSDCGYGGLSIHALMKHGIVAKEGIQAMTENDYPVNRIIPDLEHLGILPSDIKKYFSAKDCTEVKITPEARALLMSLKRRYIENHMELDAVPEIELLLQTNQTLEGEQLDCFEAIEKPWSVFIDFKIRCKSIRTCPAAPLHIIGEMFAAKVFKNLTKTSFSVSFPELSQSGSKNSN